MPDLPISGLPSYATTPISGDLLVIEDITLGITKKVTKGNFQTGLLVGTNNLSDISNASTARTNLGLAIGSNVQAYSANLASWSAIAPSTKLSVDGSLAMTGNLQVGSNNITGVGAVVLANNGRVGNLAATAYMDFGASGILAITGTPRLSDLTVSTIVYLNGTGDLTSLANGTGVLTNNGSGGLSWGSAGGVSSVSGTSNRITSTGGTTPVIDISATFEALLGKAASPLSQFASTTSAQLAGVISDETGSGALVFANSPTLITPALGTPSALVGTNITGTASGLTAGNVTTNANLTGDVTSVGNATTLAIDRMRCLIPTAVKTTTYSAAANDFVPCDNTSGSFTVTLPNAPADRTVVGVKMIIQGGTNTITVACAGSDVINKTGGVTSFTISYSGQAYLLQYKSSSAIWYVIADDLPKTALDTIYAPIASPTFTGTVTVPTGAVLGTPASVTLTNATGLPLSTGVIGTLSVAKGGTGLTTEAAGSIIAYNTLDTATAITSTSGLKVLQNNAGTISWVTTTGTGDNVLATTPTLITPVLGVATATSINKVAITAPATSATLTLADTSSLITSGAFSITLTSTATTNVTLPTTGTLATLAGSESLSNKTLPGFTLSGLITCTSTPNIGTAAAPLGTLNAQAISFTSTTNATIDFSAGSGSTTLGTLSMRTANTSGTQPTTAFLQITTGDHSNATAASFTSGNLHIDVGAIGASSTNIRGHVEFFSRSATAQAKTVGAGVLYIGDRYTAPSTTPTTGYSLYSESSRAMIREDANRFIVQAAASTKTTAGAPYTNDGFVSIVINGSTIKVMTTA